MIDNESASGTGKGTVFGVLTTMFLLAATLIILLALALTNWWGDREDLSAVTPPGLTEVRMTDSPRLGQAENPADWITSDDYPAEAIRREIEGRVRIRMEVAASGRLSRCVVVSSSGSPLLDDATCNAVKRNARFSPRYDEDGRAIAFIVSRSVVWRLPT